MNKLRRKVTKHGSATLSVSLPSKWAKKYGIKKGDEIDVVEDKNSIRIVAGKSEKPSSAEIYVKKPNRLISRSIFNLYRKGISQITVKYDDPIIIKDIYRYLPILMGFEITHEGKDFTVLKNVLKVDETNFDNTLRRLYLITKSLADETYKAIKDKKYEELKGISELESAQNRLYMFCCRVINLKGDSLFDHPSLMYLMIQRLEDIADHYKYICNYLLELNDKRMNISKGTISFLGEVNDMLNSLYDLYYSFSIDTTKKIIEGKKQLIKKGLGLLEKVPKKEIRLVSMLNSIVVSIYETSSPICGIHL